jgi:nitrate reductase gamma subunit
MVYVVGQLYRYDKIIGASINLAHINIRATHHYHQTNSKLEDSGWASESSSCERERWMQTLFLTGGILMDEQTFSGS